MRNKSTFSGANNNPLAAALGYAKHGWPVYPVWPRDGDNCGCPEGEKCKHPGKHPIGRLLPNGKDDAATNKEVIKRWWGIRPSAGIGMPTGVPSGVVVIDVDTKNEKSGFESLRKLQEKLGPLPATLSARTPTGGGHFYFEHAVGISSSQEKLGKGIDVRGEGGSIILPPSHGLYEWTEPRESVAKLPQAWIEHIRKLKSSDHYHSIDDDKRLNELAALDPFEYERQRMIAAKQLGVRPSVLDREIMKRRELQLSQTGFLEPTVPWTTAVDGDAVLDELFTTVDRHVVLPKCAVTAIALWVLHAHAHDAATHSPILIITSPTKRCGKTTLLAVLNKLVPKPLPSANVTPATIYRAIERFHPTWLIDEADAFLKDKNELRGVLDSGHERSQAFVLRCVGDDLVPTTFSTWAPKAIAVIGRLHPTLEDRSIKIELKRRLPIEGVERLPRNKEAFTELRRKCARWANDNIEMLRVAQPKVPTELHDRARDNWDPLLAISDACGGEWPVLAREAARRLSAVDDDETHAILLLGDLKFLFDQAYRDGGDNLSSQLIVDQLAKMEDRPWPEFSNGKPISPRGVAKLLKEFKIFPRQVKVGERKLNGYRPEQFIGTFKRYLSPDVQGSSAPSEKSKTSTGSDGSMPLNNDRASDDKNTRKPLHKNGFQSGQRQERSA